MKERSVSFSVITLLFHVAVIFPFFGGLINFFIGRYIDNAIVYAVIDLLFLYFGIVYVLHYFEKKVIVQNPVKVFKISFALYAIITFGIYLIYVKSSMSAPELIGWFFFYWLKVVLFHELTKKYFYALVPQYEKKIEEVPSNVDPARRNHGVLQTMWSTYPTKCTCMSSMWFRAIHTIN